MIRNKKVYKEMTPYIACSIVEGFCDEPVSQEEAHAAWQYIIDTKLWTQLQGWYGRTANNLIKNGLCVNAHEKESI